MFNGGFNASAKFGSAFLVDALKPPKGGLFVLGVVKSPQKKA